MTITDGLTMLSNRRYFDERIKSECARASRSHKYVSLIMIDIDHFKQFNDHYGHLAGDKCLKDVADVLTQTTRRADDVAARYGGEEFALIFPGLEENQTGKIAEELRSSIEELGIPHAMSSHQVVTISVGVATVAPDKHFAAKQLIALADSALYQAKNRGRNQIVTSK